MQVLIKNGKNNYTSYVLAISDNEFFFDKKIIVFTPNYDSIKIVNLYRKEKNEIGSDVYMEALIFNYNEDDFINKNGWFGVKDVVSNNEILERLNSNQSIPISNINGIKQYAKEIKIPKWYEINSEKDIQTLENISSWFHDAYLDNAKRKDNSIFLTFDAWKCTINLQFIDVIEENLYGKVYEIFDSKFEILDGNCFKWTVLDGFEGWTDGTNGDSIGGVFIKCKKILWNFIHEFN